MTTPHLTAFLSSVLRGLAAGVAFTAAATTATFVTASDVLRVMLEEPVAGETHGGVGNLRGWAVASEGIEKLRFGSMGHMPLTRHMAALGAMSAAPSPR